MYDYKSYSSNRCAIFLQHIQEKKSRDFNFCLKHSYANMKKKRANNVKELKKKVQFALNEYRLFMKIVKPLQKELKW